MNLDQLADAVLQRLNTHKPRALLIGEDPIVDSNYNYVNEKPYEAVIIGKLSPEALFRMPTDVVCTALLEQIPVYLLDHQSWKDSKTARALCRELSLAQQRLYRLGVRPLHSSAKLLTADDARTMRLSGKTPEQHCRMTPLARDILEGRSP